LEETWVNARENVFKELQPYLKFTDEDKQLILVVHIESVKGFVEGGLLYVETKTNTSDYHDRINGDIFYDWFCGILPLLNENSVIVFDNASYYSVKDYVLTMSWKTDCILK